MGVISVIILGGFKLGISNVPNRNDMGQVYKMGQKAGSENAEYFVFEEEKLFGMQFYLNGMMQRVTLTGKESWADANIDDLISSLRSEESNAEYLILSSTKKAPLIERAFSDSNLDIQKTENKYWIWFRVTQKEE
jgi:hypothetical protein